MNALGESGGFQVALHVYQQTGKPCIRCGTPIVKTKSGTKGDALLSELSKAKNRKVGFVLGLTGGIATGKSTAAKVFQSHGFPLIDGDVIARETVEPGTLALRKIVSVFGQEVLQPDGQLDRGKLGMIVFPSKENGKNLISY